MTSNAVAPVSTSTVIGLGGVFTGGQFALFGNSSLYFTPLKEEQPGIY